MSVFFKNRAFWFLLALDALVLSAGIIAYNAVEPGASPSFFIRKPVPIDIDILSESREPLPDDWQRFLPPGVEELSKERPSLVDPSAVYRGARVLNSSPYEQAVEATKEEAKASARALRKQQFQERQDEAEREYNRAKETRQSDLNLQSGIGWGTAVFVLVLSIVAGRIRVQVPAKPSFCWKCGRPLAGGEGVGERAPPAPSSSIPARKGNP